MEVLPSQLPFNKKDNEKMRERQRETERDEPLRWSKNLPCLLPTTFLTSLQYPVQTEHFPLPTI
jgi:hypothetical protein